MRWKSSTIVILPGPLHCSDVGRRKSCVDGRGSASSLCDCGNEEPWSKRCISASPHVGKGSSERFRICLDRSARGDCWPVATEGCEIDGLSDRKDDGICFEVDHIVIVELRCESALFVEDTGHTNGPQTGYAVLLINDDLLRTSPPEHADLLLLSLLDLEVLSRHLVP